MWDATGCHIFVLGLLQAYNYTDALKNERIFKQKITLYLIRNYLFIYKHELCNIIIQRTEGKPLCTYEKSKVDDYTAKYM